ncbi:MAG: histidinol-phosphate transaminase [Clostridiales bacterium]|nr:histidinol-phosphate transaminase [Clostridiales bacterium]
MSRFMSRRHLGLEAYVPGEQPRNRAYVKLNTNESPFPPSEGVTKAVQQEAEKLRLYSDPECRDLVDAVAEFYGIDAGQVLMTNGSDEALEYVFQAFGDKFNTFAFPDITYGFYPVFAQLYSIPFEEIPLQRDFTIATEDYRDIGKNIVIANPNAHTGIALSLNQIETIISTNREHVVVIDEAYVDFGGESAVPLIKKYDNLLVIRTFSKSYSLAGARLGICMGNKSIIRDLNTIKYSKNPYNVNRMTMAAGLGAIEEVDYYEEKCKIIAKNRDGLKVRLRAKGFYVLDSSANFLLIAHESISGQRMFEALKEKGFLVRHLDIARLDNYNRVTIGTESQMNRLVEAIEEVIEEESKQGGVL